MGRAGGLLGSYRSCTAELGELHIAVARQGADGRGRMC